MKKKYNVLLGMLLCAGVLIPLNYFNILGFDTGSSETIIYDDCPECPECPESPESPESPEIEDINVNMSLHQSFVNLTKKNLNNDLNYTYNNIPNLENYYAINEKILIDNISAGDYKKEVNDTSVHPNSYYGPYYASFIAPNTTCYLDNLTIYAAANGGPVNAYVLNSSKSGNDPYRPQSVTNRYTLNAIPSSFGYISSLNNYLELDPSNTTDNVWFIGLESGAQFTWTGDFDSSGSDDSVCYGFEDQAPDFQNPEDFDYNYEINFTLGKKQPNSKEINLRINNTAVTPVGGNNGVWINEEEKNISGSEIIYNFSSGWPNCNWTINKTIINFTKSDVFLDYLNFTVANNQDVYWNLTKSVSSFSPQFNNYTINYTVPNDWDFYALYNGSEKMPDSYYLNSFPLGNGYKNITMNATNGYWILVMIKVFSFNFF